MTVRGLGSGAYAMHAGRRAAGIAAATLAMLTAWGSPVQAQGRDGTTTLGAIYRVLADSSPRLEAARQLSRAAGERIVPARTLPDPVLQFGLMNRSLPGLGLQQPLGMNTVQLMQMVPLAGKLGLAGAVARAQAEAARARENGVNWDLRAQTAMAFYEVYQLDRSLAVARETRQVVRDLADIVRAMYSVGEGRQPDVLRAEVELARTDEEILRMQAMRTSAVARLNGLLHRPPNAPLVAVVRPVFPAALPALDSLQLLADSNRPMLGAARRDLDAARAQARLARREIWPDLQLGLQYGQQPMPGGGTDRMMSFMLGFSVPLFAGRRQLPMRREAAAMQLMAEADLSAMRSDTWGRLGELYAAIDRSARLAALYRSSIVPEAEATLASALAAYRQGSVDFMTVLDDQRMLNEYRQAVFALEAEQGQALAELEMLVGRSLVDPDSQGESLLPEGGQ